MADSCDSTNVVARTSGPGSVTMHVSGHTLLIAGTQSANVELFDMQGRPVFSAKCENGSVELKGIPEGLYVARVRSGSYASEKPCCAAYRRSRSVGASVR